MLAWHADAHFFSVTVQAHEVRKLIKTFRAAIIRRDEAVSRKVGGQLYAHLLQPLEPFIKGKHLFILPDAALMHVPVEALVDAQGRYVLENHSVRYYFSANSAFRNRQTNKKRPSSKRPEMLAVAPDFGKDNLLNLPGTQMETQVLEQDFNSTVLMGPEATRSRFLSLAPQYSLLHLGTHAHIRDSVPQLSYLNFAPEGAHDTSHFLYVYELYNLRLRADLVTLSACSSGYNPDSDEEGMSTLASGFAYSGCASLIAALWEVDDQASSELMTLFYNNLSKGLSKSKSLHLAKQTYVKNAHRLRQSPYFWAGFLYYGDSERLNIGSGRVWSRSYVFILFIGLAACFIGLVIKILFKKNLDQQHK